MAEPQLGLLGAAVLTNEVGSLGTARHARSSVTPPMDVGFTVQRHRDGFGVAIRMSPELDRTARDAAYDRVNSAKLRWASPLTTATMRGLLDEMGNVMTDRTASEPIVTAAPRPMNGTDATRALQLTRWENEGGLTAPGSETAGSTAEGS